MVLFWKSSIIISPNWHLGKTYIFRLHRCNAHTDSLSLGKSLICFLLFCCFAVEVVQLSIVRGLRNVPISQWMQLPHHCEYSHSNCTIRSHQRNTQSKWKWFKYGRNRIKPVILLSMYPWNQSFTFVFFITKTKTSLKLFYPLCLITLFEH